MKIYLDGKWVAPERAKISVFDHGVLYGDGVFEGIRAYNGTPFRLLQHIDRLFRSAQLISLKIPMSAEKLSDIVRTALVKNRLKDSYIRLVVTRGVGDLGLDPRACPKPSVFVIAAKLALFPEKCYVEGLSAIFARTKRNLTEALDPTIKSLNYLNNILAKIEANQNGVPEAIMINHQGHVAECTGDNVFYVKDGSIVTPPVSAGVLEGITRSLVISLVKTRTSYKMSEELFPPDALFNADEVFFTGTAAEVIPVTRIDGRPIGNGKPGRVTQEMIGHFRSLINEETASAQ